MTERLERLAGIVAATLGIPAEQITRNTDFIDDLGMDSLDRIEIALAVTDEFDIDMSDREMREFVTLGELDYVVSRRLGE